MRNDGSTRPTVMILAAAVLWGLIGPFSLWAGRQGLTAVDTAFWRAALAALPFALLTGFRGERLTRDAAKGGAIFGLIGIAVMYVAFFVAVERTGAGVAAVLLYTGPAWVALYEWTAARQAPSARSMGALLLTIAGIVLVSYLPAVEHRLDRIGVLAGLASGISYATHYTYGRKQIGRYGAAVVYTAAMLSAAAVVGLWSRPSLPASGAWLPLLILALVSTFAASLLFARGVIAVSPVRAALTATIEPVVAMIISILFLGAAFHAQQLAGAALVLGGVTLIILEQARPETPRPETRSKES